MRLLARLGVIGGIIAGLLAVGLPAHADNVIGNRNKCDDRNVVDRSNNLKINAFAGHAVEFNYKVCWIRNPPGHVGPIPGEGKVVFAGNPVIRTPTRFPGGGVLEELEVIKGGWSGPSNAPVYKFSVKQEVFHIPGSQTFRFNVTISSGHRSKIIKMCMLPRACTHKGL